MKGKRRLDDDEEVQPEKRARSGASDGPRIDLDNVAVFERLAVPQASLQLNEEPSSDFFSLPEQPAVRPVLPLKRTRDEENVDNDIGTIPTSLYLRELKRQRVELGLLVFHEDDADDIKGDEGLPSIEKRARCAVRLAVRNGELCDRYDIEAILGFGTFGVVLRARPRENEGSGEPVAPVAIKLAYKYSDLGTKPLDLLSEELHGSQQEVNILEKATKPFSNANVVNLLHTWEDEHFYFIVTNLVGHEASTFSSSLNFFDPARNRAVSIPYYDSSKKTHSSNWCRRMASSNSERGLPPLPMARGIFAQLVRGLFRLHAKRIAHGDLKGDNILVSAIDTDRANKLDHRLATMKNPTTQDLADLAAEFAPQAVIVDLGLATTGNPAPPEKARYGTWQFCAPEILSNLEYSGDDLARTDAFTADVFALGLCLHQLLHGYHHFPRAAKDAAQGKFTVFKRLDKLWIEDDSEYPLEYLRPDLDAEGRRLLKSMLCMDPDERPTISMVMDSPWVVDVFK
ncbi:hypothetical protein HDU96_003788, partial [Phlyctochytrium bullatum]